MRFDPYIATDLNREMQNPAALVVYLYLTVQAEAAGAPYFISHQKLANATGLSKATIQRTVAFLEDRKLVAVKRTGPTAEPGYTPLQPWKRRR